MRRIKPLYISILTVLVFIGAVLIGMQTDWWQTDGRKTPLDGVTVSEHTEDSETEETETHEEGTESGGLISGGSTVQDVLNMGLSEEQIADIFGGPIDAEDPAASLKTLTEARGLKFGEVKDELNRLIGE